MKKYIISRLVPAMIMLISYCHVFATVNGPESDLLENSFFKYIFNKCRYNYSKVKAPKILSNADCFYDTTKWAKVLDETWGCGLSTEKKLSMFDKYWDTLNLKYSCFINLKPVNWDSLGKALRAEIAKGVSKGRYAGIMCHLISIINDGHTAFYDRDIRWTPPFRGMPALIDDSKYQFPACISVDNVGKVVVYDAPPNNVFNLRPGDIIMGYNDQSVDFLADQVLRHQLPNYTLTGSTYSATRHRLLVSVAASWYLFDTVNIKKADGSIENYPVSLMEDQSIWNKCYEMVPVEGITLPFINDIYRGKMVYSTVLEGINTGYVIFFDCLDFSGDSLLNHVKNLVENKKVRGLIIDIRTNFGGTILAFDKTMKYLKKGNTLNWLGCATRADEKDRFSMAMNTYSIQGYNIYDDDPAYFDKPIALLVGPNAISAGDILPVLFKHHKNLRTFGNPTAGAFGSITNVELDGGYSYMGVYQDGNFYEPSKPSVLLSHLEFPVDEEVWFTTGMLAQGKDDVMEAAKGWIKSATSGIAENELNEGIALYPNPVADNLTVNIAESENCNSALLRIYNNLGILCLESEVGNYSIISVDELPSGFYNVVIELNGKLKYHSIVKI
jgi:hypothetical protein